MAMETSKCQSNSTTTPRLRVLMFPFLAHGHISPFLELSKRLAKNYNFQIYFCSTEINLSFIKKNRRDLDNYLSDHSVELVQLDLPHLPDLPPHYHTTKNLPSHLHHVLHIALYMAKTNFQNIVNTLKPDLLIYDFFLAWAAELASLIHIPSVLFLCVGAVSWSHRYLDHDHANPSPGTLVKDHEAKQEAIFEQFMKNLPEDVSHALVDLYALSKCFQVSSEIVLVKSWRDIEGKYMDHLSLCCGKKIIPIGPLISTQLKLGDDNKILIEFLNERDQSSVVYVSFGSECFLSEEEREEMAYGLELSNANFIWVVRFPGGHAIALEEALPKGFLERVKERGVVVDGWAPQDIILAHPSTGGFLSHCGWGSFTESIYHGVPLLALPMQYEQPLTARLAAEIGVGIEILKNEDGKLKKEEVARVINEVVVERKEKGKLLQARTKELSQKLREEGDEREFREAVGMLKSLRSKNNTSK